MNHSRYRKDLQGLRAVAVGLVVAAHAGIPGVAGGFVGVDVFFVLSGYLISGLLADEYTRTGRIALGSFYARRLRRLLPAMLLMIATTVAFSAWLLSTSEAHAMLASTPFAASWTSNLFFAFRSFGYFDELAAKDLFLHTWSLGVEEQFYLIWPFVITGLLWFAARDKGKWRAASLLAGIIILGAIGCIAWTQMAPMQAFYLTPARIWQFALGAFVFIVLDRKASDITSRIATIIFGVGLVAIVASALLFDTNASYPGARAIVPSLGAALVIAAGRSLLLAAWWNPLSDSRMVWIGDRSYSIYLWHWPVLTLASALGFGSTAVEICALLAVTLLLSMLSYRFVELPFWKGSLSSFTPRRALLGGFVVISLAFAGSLQALRAPPPALLPQYNDIAAIRHDVPQIYQFGCDAWYEHARVEPCVFDSGSAKHTAVFIGDSIGAQWFSAFPVLFPPPEWRLVVLTKSSCPIVDEDIFYERIGATYTVCSEWRNAALDWIEKVQPDVVLIGGTGSTSFNATQWVEGSQRIFRRVSKNAEQVFVIGGTPQLGIDGPGCIERALEKEQSVQESCRGKPIAPWVSEVIGYLTEAAHPFNNVDVLDLTAVVCPDGICSAVTGEGMPVFRDSQHLTDVFVRSRIQELRTAMNAATNP